MFWLLARCFLLHLLPGISGQLSDHHAADALPAGRYQYCNYTQYTHYTTHITLHTVYTVLYTQFTLHTVHYTPTDTIVN